MCAGDDALLTATGSGLITWYSDIGATTQVGSGTSFLVSSATSTTFFFAVQQEGACASDTLAVPLIVMPVPTGVSIEGPTTVCVGDTLQLLLVGPPGTDATWSTPGGSITAPGILIAPVAPGDSGLYEASTFIGDCPGDVVSVVVDVNEAMTIDLGPDTALCEDQPMILQLPAGFYSILWSTGANTQAITAYAPGIYTVEAMDPRGCAANGQLVIDLMDCSVYIPNVFSPNDDGDNDVLEIIGFGEPLSLVIYNRWGQQVAELRGDVVKWNGRETSTNEPVPEGVYYYEAMVPIQGIEPIRKAGYVQVVR